MAEIILPISTQKHDPAWKHCLMVKSAGRTRLKCKYCEKQFLGGGIHRIKEHLARHKGNASCCPRVPAEVQQAMQQSLEGSAARKKRKLRLADDLRRLNPGHGFLDDPAGSALALADPDDPGIAVASLPVGIDSGALAAEVKEEAAGRAPERGRRKRARSSPAPPAFSGPEIRPCSWVPAGDGDQASMAICRFLYDIGAPSDAVNSVYFQPMLDAVAAAGPGLQLSYHDARGLFLRRSFEEVSGMVERTKATWARTGCSVLVDEWITESGKTIMSFLVYCPEGTVFLRSMDASPIVASEEALYELLKHVVEEVGERNVVQVVTSNSETHAMAGRRLMESFPTLFWTPCASQCIDSMLEDIGKMEGIGEIIENAKSITGFIYSHAMVLNLVRKYTSGRDLILPSGSRAATNFLTLKSMAGLKDELRAMVNSEEWFDGPYSKKPEGVMMANLVDSQTFWNSCAALVRITEPLVRVLKLAASNKRPAMGYIFVAMYQAKEAIKKALGRRRDYVPYWDIIDWRWDRQLPRPLYAAAFHLNPQFYYSVQGDLSNEISSAMLDCIERLVPEGKIQDKVQKELNMYKSAAGDFGRKMAVRARHTLLPAEWWSTYGGGCPNLTRLAIRVLSQTCSARGCERNHIPFEQIHNQRLNHLERLRLSDLTFASYNLRLQQKKLLRSKPFDPISADNADIVDDWVVEKSGLLADEDSSWMVLNQPMANEVLSDYTYDDDAETFSMGLDEEIIRGAGRGVDDDIDIKEEEDSRDGTSFI